MADYMDFISQAFITHWQEIAAGLTVLSFVWNIIQYHQKNSVLSNLKQIEANADRWMTKLGDDTSNAPVRETLRGIRSLASAGIRNIKPRSEILSDSGPGDSGPIYGFLLRFLVLLFGIKRGFKKLMKQDHLHEDDL